MVKTLCCKIVGVLFALVSIIVPYVLHAEQGPSVAPRITETVDESRRITLVGNTHPLARPGFDQGVASDNQPMNRILLLLQRSPAQETALRQLLDAQQSKSSPNFHHWIGPHEFGERFGPADADIQVIKGWLASHGFSVDHISQGKTIIEFSGNAGAIRSAFNTEMHKYIVDGREHWANATDPQIPAALAPVVAGPVSLNNFDIPPAIRRPALAAGHQQAATTSSAFTPGSSAYAIGPYDFATIYNAQPLWSSTPPIDGTGQIIALAEQSDICTVGSPDFSNPNACGSTPVRDDIGDFRSYFGLSTTLPGGAQAVQVIVNGPNPGIVEPIPSVTNPNTPNNEEEALLDAEVAGGVAKGAQINLVVSQTTEVTEGFKLSAEYVVDNNLAPVLSVSFLGCQANLGSSSTFFFDSLWEQAAAQGITVAVSAGDTGSAGCDAKGTAEVSYGLAVNGIAATPFNVAVGGTDLDDAGKQSMYWRSSGASSALSYIPEVPWNNSCAASVAGCSETSPSSSLTDAAGGGQSSCFNTSTTSDPYCPKPAP
ncbi:MAG: protease pro-enzyme activation domain-containing protein [Terriglobia bacterium]